MNKKKDLEQIIIEKDAYIAELEALVKFLKEQLMLSKNQRFGRSSEKDVLSCQLSLLSESEKITDTLVPELVSVTYTRRKRIGKREDDLSSLPIEIVEHRLPEDKQICPECGGSLHAMGHDTRRELKIIPAQVKVLEHRRYVYSCRRCEKTSDHVPIVKAAMPAPVIKGSIASPSALAYIMTQKYMMHLPLYRQEQSWKYQGVVLSRQTMANWIVRSAEDWLLPIYDRLRCELLRSDLLHADESVLQVLKEPGKAPVSNSYMWLYRTSGDVLQHIILYEYQPSRSHIHPLQFLKEFKGLLHADGYAGYHKLPPEITIVGCWVHLRRKFTDALKTIPPDQKTGSVAYEALSRIGHLFHLEDLWLYLLPEERYKLRLSESIPIALELFDWLRSLMILPKSATGRAIHYALEQQKWLMNVYLDGRCELSNNRIENSVRPYALGRKNWLFCNTVNGARASAIVYTIIETAKANGLKPFEYLEFLFETLPNTTSRSLDSFLPWGEGVPEYCLLQVKKEAAQSA